MNPDRELSIAAIIISVGAIFGQPLFSRWLAKRDAIIAQRSKDPTLKALLQRRKEAASLVLFFLALGLVMGFGLRSILVSQKPLTREDAFLIALEVVSLWALVQLIFSELRDLNEALNDLSAYREKQASQ